MPVNNSEKVPVNLVGSSVFGRYPWISTERTYNMFISDDKLVNYPGFQKIDDFNENAKGRGAFKSTLHNVIIAVIGSTVFFIDSSLFGKAIGTLESTDGDVFIDDSPAGQVCIVDGLFAYIYNYSDQSFTKQTIPFAPQYVSYHNTFFLLTPSISDINPQNWYVYEFATNSTITLVTQLSIQTKPDTALAALRIPGQSNHIIVFGQTLSEFWAQVGGTQNYQKVTTATLDVGVLSTATIASNENYIAWLSVNEKNSPSIMILEGTKASRISTDGIDYLLSILKHPENSAASIFKIDGHLFYQLTFYDPTDNMTFTYDFNTQKFFNITDEASNYHPMRQLVNYNKKLLFISLNDSGLYELSTDFHTYNYNNPLNKFPDLTLDKIIPRKRITNTLRSDNAERFRCEQITFLIEEGISVFSKLDEAIVIEPTYIIDEDLDFLISEDGLLLIAEASEAPEKCFGLIITEDDNQIISEDNIELIDEEGYCLINFNPFRSRVDLSISKNGNHSFGNKVNHYLNPSGQYRGQIRWWGIGQANSLTLQLEFWGKDRFVVGNGIMDIINDNS